MELFSGNKNKVIVSRDEVADFIKTFPDSKLCSGGPRHYWFEFDKNGDLIDTDIPEHEDGAGAVALSQDALLFWADSHGLPYPGH